MKEIKYITDLFSQEGPSQLLGEFNNIGDIEAYINGSFPICYKDEPPYPYVWVRLEGIDEFNHRNSISYCYYGK